jgi:hypothetical protein
MALGMLQEQLHQHEATLATWRAALAQSRPISQLPGRNRSRR